MYVYLYMYMTGTPSGSEKGDALRRWVVLYDSPFHQMHLCSGSLMV